MRGQVRLGLGSIGAECSLMGGVGRDVRGGEEGGCDGERTACTYL